MKRKLVIVFAFVATCAIMLVYREPLVALLAPAEPEAYRFAVLVLDETGDETATNREPTALAAGASSFSHQRAMPDTGADGVPVAYGSQTSTDLVLQSALSLAALPPIEADVRHSTNLFGNRLDGTGKYVQAGQGSSKARLELSFGGDDFDSRITQINDGRFLYTSNDAEKEPTLQRIDLATLEPGSMETSTGTAPRQRSAANWMAVGGLTFLMHQLANDFDFAPPEQTTKEDSDLILVRGTWKPSRISNICGKLPVLDNDRNIVAGDLPPQLPTHVEILLSQKEPFVNFPQQITWLRETTDINDKRHLRAITSYEFFDVRMATDLPLATFQIEKNTARLTDITDTVLKNADSALRLR